MSTGKNEIAQEVPSFVIALRVWARIGLLSFGGPAGQIALMHQVLVDEKSWLSEKDFLSALSFCMLLPGPEAMQLATFVGWRLHGWRGGLAAGLLFVIPGALVVLALSTLYAYLGDVQFVSAIFIGIKAAVIVIVLAALRKVAGNALKTSMHWALAGLSFIAIFFFQVPFPAIVVLAGLIGFFSTKDTAVVSTHSIPLSHLLPQTIRTVLLWMFVWFFPLFLLAWLAPALLFDIGLFFSKLAVVTFGGAYAVLAYLAQDVVQQHQWLSAGEMMDGLGLAETTPGPLILVTEFVGFLAGFREGGLALGLMAALTTLWVTFVPCFLWIFAGAPYMQWISEQPKLSNALATITAAVVGVILNLSLWFSLHVLFDIVDQRSYLFFNLWVPEWHTFDWRVLMLTLVCGGLVFGLRWGILRVLCISGLAGLLLWL